MEADALFVFLSYALAVVLAGAGGVLMAFGSVPRRSWRMVIFATVSLLGATLLIWTAFGSRPWLFVVFVLVAVLANAVTSALRWKLLPQLSGAQLPELLRLVLLRPDILRRMAADAAQLEADRLRRERGRG
ncbi:drug/metabolite transporter (DMT)-like permease [Pseudoclavibacter sp. JAI123]|uniref:hypothetical protein n=1 Tax=Pseudoclavibacter sp. JAI123 TaxID=2723065 RepID=UPI0015CE7ECA|nr:hypothetical protein [Pseudoclavibacter sp. JAI123]NYF14417.1 drug/metabolite transporter (DMT)-like permease [Pseudoclavibacter sp. JAI123]